MSKLYVDEIAPKTTGGTVTITNQAETARVAFRAQKTNGDVSATNTVLFNDIGVNEGTCYSSSTGKFVAPSDGNYFFGFTGRHQGAVRVQVAIKKNDVTVMQMRSTSTNGTMGNMNLAGTGVITLSLGDDVKCVVTGGGPLGGGTDGEGAVFTGFKL